MRYQIVSSDQLQQLEKMVNNELRHGWEVTGGLISYRGINDEVEFAQAMIKHGGPE
jgi:hypothetical protein